MRKNILKTLLILSISDQAYAKDLSKYYIKASVGANFAHTVSREAGPNIAKKINSTNLDHKGDKSLGGTLAFGYNISNNISVEIGSDYINENSYKDYTGKGQRIIKMNIISPKISLFYNHDLNDKIALYIGGGVGSSFISGTQEHYLKNSAHTLKKAENLDQKTTFFGSGELGARFYIDKKSSFDLGYGFGYHGKPYDFNIMVHSLKASITYNF